MPEKDTVINLFWLQTSDNSPSWNLGRVVHVKPTVQQLREAVCEHLKSDSEDFLLFWDSRLPLPDPDLIRSIRMSRGDVWHAGLRLGLSGQPSLIHSVESTWPLNADPDPTIESTSWRLSLRAALIPAQILKHFNFIRPEFETIDMAALELGHRFIKNGVLVRHIPDLLPDEFIPLKPDITFEDEVRFISARHGSFWLKWSLMRASLNKKIKLHSFTRHLKKNALNASKKVQPYHSEIKDRPGDLVPRKVTVLIPTLNRNEYLRKLLDQLRHQTVPPLEILVIDQTEQEFRDTSISTDFDDLPLQVIYRDHAGQCSSRNAGLQLAKGDYILFLDDDSEIPDDLIEKHLISLDYFQADVSSGVAEEVGAGSIPENFRLIRASDVFPTNNTLIHKSILNRSGLFDLAYERGERADGDLGMRVYLSGGFMVLNPDIRILHHHAPSGGLRTHKARVITYASSRSTLLHRHLPSKTEIYLAQRYFSHEILREMLWLRAAGTFSHKGNSLQKMLKFIISLVLLPNTISQIKKRAAMAESLLKQFPQIPQLSEQEKVTAKTI